MLKITQDTKIYVYCPSGVVSGGPELLHQLVDKLNCNGCLAFIVYFGPKEHKIANEYSSYHIRLSEAIEDNKENIVVVPEGQLMLLQKGIEIQKILWWLSVDNFYTLSYNLLHSIDLINWQFNVGIKITVARIRRLFSAENLFKNNISLKIIRNMQILHAYQSEYAQHFLLKHHFNELYPLKDYINIEHFKNHNEFDREDIVLYNPQKGLEFTKKLMVMTPEIHWVAIQNMTRAELVSLMRKSKLYIDFGNHPGKDRLPREAAMNGCCVITGKDGSAGFFEDVPINASYKFNQTSNSKKYIVAQIKNVISNYEKCIDDFEFYRYSILSEKNEFDRQVTFLFHL